MAELGPEMRAGRRAGAGQPRQLFLSAVIMDHDVERAFQVIGINLDVARKQQPCTGLSPTPVEGLKSRSGMVVEVGNSLAHRAFGDAVGEFGATRQGQRLGKIDGHIISVQVGTRLGAGSAGTLALTERRATVIAVILETVVAVARLSSHESAAVRINVVQTGDVIGLLNEAATRSL